jgi:hypothetical protein
VNIIVPLPLAPPPYRAEAIHSWLTRVATPYSLKPRQLLHALHVWTNGAFFWNARKLLIVFRKLDDLQRGRMIAPP